MIGVRRSKGSVFAHTLFPHVCPSGLEVSTSRGPMTIGHTCRLRNRRQLVAIRALACMAIGSACGAFASRTVTAPQPVARERTLISLTEGGGAYAGGLTSGGAAYAWGENLYGNLGDGTNTDRNSRHSSRWWLVGVAREITLPRGSMLCENGRDKNDFCVADPRLFRFQ